MRSSLISLSRDLRLVKTVLKVSVQFYGGSVGQTPVLCLVGENGMGKDGMKIYEQNLRRN